MIKYVLYTKEILLLHGFGQSHQHSALFHWVLNVNSCTVFIISTAGDSLYQRGSSTFHRAWTKPEIACNIRGVQGNPVSQDPHLFASKNKPDLSSSQMRLK